MIVGQRAGDSVVIAGKGLRSTVIEDASVQAAMQPWFEMEYYQLTGGKSVAQMQVLDLGEQRLVRERQLTSVQKIGISADDTCTVSFCTSDPTFRFADHQAGGDDTLFFMPEKTEIDIFAPAGVQTNYVSFSQAAFLRDARVLNPRVWGHAPREVIALTTPEKAAARGAINLCFNATGATSDMLLKMIVQAAAGTPNDELPSYGERLRAFHICRMARTFVDDSLAVDVVPTIVDICRSVGVSERSLQYAFRAYVDMSPLTYLRLCRLNRVRATLRTSAPQTTTVTSVAMRFGFLHLGRFALDYRQVFDEPPSATLAS